MQYQEALRVLTDAGQQHLLAYWDELGESARTQLLQQIEQIDFPVLNRLFQDAASGPDWRALAQRAEPPPAYRADGSGGPIRAEQARAAGEAALQEGSLGLILVAGGQGTRLGYDHPKGLYQLGPISGRSLFQILIDRLRAVQRRYGVRIPLYVMTSPATHEETQTYLRSIDYGGQPAEDVMIFCQGVMPAVDAESGRVLMEAKDALCLSPDGHGGMLAAFARHGCLADARSRGVTQLFYAQIDNPLAPLCDPQFIGYHVLSNSELTTQVVAKVHALERVGNVVGLHGQVQIIEYSDLPEEVARRTNPDGSLYLWAGNIAVHVLARSFLERVAGQAGALPFHRALKKTPCLDARGKLHHPDQPNAIKFEKFIFDLLPLAHNAIAVEALKKDAFAPVKNAPKAETDTPEQAQAAMVAQHRSWLESAGVSLAPGTPVEINPLWALDAEQVRDNVRQRKDLAPGAVIREPLYLEGS